MAKTRLTKDEIEQRKNHAKLLYTREGVITQKELAQRVGISEKTIGLWIKDEKWEKERASVILTKEEELRRIYEQLTELNDCIRLRPKGSRYSDTKEADILIKLSATIKNLETEVSVAEAIEVLKKLINLTRKESLADAKVITKWSDILIKTLLK